MNLSHLTLRSYLTGFVLSIVLTLAAYIVVVQHAFPAHILLAAIITFAALQFLVQMIFFLHLNGGAQSRERLAVLGFATVIVVILVSGSLWIMNNLNSRMMPTPEQMELYMNSQIGI